MGQAGLRGQPGLVGLENFDNTCYMNASVQCLAHTKLLVRHLLERHDLAPSRARRRDSLEGGAESTAGARGARSASGGGGGGGTSSPGGAGESHGRGDGAGSGGSRSERRGAGGAMGGEDGAGSRSPRGAEAKEVEMAPVVASDGPASDSREVAGVHVSKGARGDDENQRLLEELVVLVREIWSGKREFVKPHRLKAVVDRIEERFKGVKEQHDAFEFLLEVVISRLHRALRRGAETRPKGSRRRSAPGNASGGEREGAGSLVLFHEGGARETPPLTELEVKFEAELKRQAQTAWERRLAEKGRSIITDHLHGQLKQSARCLTCGSVTVTFPLFVYLELSLQPGDPEPVPLDLLLKRFGEELCVPNHNCPRCSQKGGKKTQAMVSRQLWRLPDVAMLRIGRVFHPTPSEDIKITLRVAFPVAALDLGACIAATSPFRPARASMAVSAAQPDAGHLASSSSGDHADGLFDLYAVLHHQGQTPVQGHYVADVRHASDNNFYNINDTKIVPCELAPQPPPAEVAERGGPNAERPVFVSSDAYILFYESRVSSGERAFFTGRRNLADERNKCRGCL